MLRQQSLKCTSLAARFFFTSYKSTWLTAISSHCLAALPAAYVFNNYTRLHAYQRNLKWTFVAMLVLPSEGQFWNYPHPSFATCSAGNGSGHEWTVNKMGICPHLEIETKNQKFLENLKSAAVSAKLHDTTTVNPALAQCECHIGK